MKDLYLKIIAGISLLALILISILFFLNNQPFVFWISIVANFVQIIMFVIWYFQKEPIPVKTIKEIEKIYVYTETKEKEYKHKERVISELVNEGLVSRDEIKKILKSVKNEEVIVCHTYGEGVKKELIKAYGGKTQPLAYLLNKVTYSPH